MQENYKVNTWILEFRGSGFIRAHTPTPQGDYWGCCVYTTVCSPNSIHFSSWTHSSTTFPRFSYWGHVTQSWKLGTLPADLDPKYRFAQAFEFCLLKSNNSNNKTSTEFRGRQKLREWKRHSEEVCGIVSPPPSHCIYIAVWLEQEINLYCYIHKVWGHLW